MSKGTEQIAMLKNWLSQADGFLDSQPPASDLDSSEQWIRQLNAHYARWAQMKGMAIGLQAQLTSAALQSLTEDSPEYKKIKNSSTLILQFAAGKWPDFWSICEQVIVYGHILRNAADNTRTLLSSYRLEREFDKRTEVKQR